MAFQVVNLRRLMERTGEERTREFLCGFSCPLNPDIEAFLKRKAIEFSKQGLSQTHLVLTSYQGEAEIAGYFCLANKPVTVLTSDLSATMRKQVEKFAVYDDRIQEHILSAPLIAQLGKNYRDGLNALISGDDLLKLACEKVSSVLFDIGGKFVYLECEDRPKLLEFYRSNRFRAFSRRYRSASDEDYLIQMLKYIH